MSLVGPEGVRCAPQVALKFAGPSSGHSLVKQFATGILLTWLALCQVSAFTPLSSNQLVFVNVDHAPVGACSTFTYGSKGDNCGLQTSSTSVPYERGGGGVLIALAGANGLEALPFVAAANTVSPGARYFSDAEVQRSLTPCEDLWYVRNGALTLTHYTPAWSMTDLTSATLTEKRRFFLPATWMLFTVNNTNSVGEQFYFGLPQSAVRTCFAGGAYQGFAIGESALAVRAGSCELLSGALLTSALSGMTNGFAFRLSVPPGQTRTLTLVVAFYRGAALDERLSAGYYYSSLFGSVDSVIDAAFAGLPDAQLRCRQLALAMNNAHLNAYRQFLASHALHSYMANTVCLLDGANRVYWREMEGAYRSINTFDLTVDHAFYDSYMHPWVLRNVLDAYSGVFTGAGYTYSHPLFDVTSGALVATNGFSFHHDMGSGTTSDAPGKDPTDYESAWSYMGQEELQNWVLSAGLYWSRSGNDAWLSNNAALLQTCLNSMLLRDDTNALARDGSTTYLNLRGSTPEITTYDSVGPSLSSPRMNGMTTVKNWACYLALEAMFRGIGDSPDTLISQNLAAACAQSIVNRWNTYRSTLGYIPAILDGSDSSALIPMVEGLSYPDQMGLTNSLDRDGGPYAAMLQALSNHVRAVLVPNRCLDGASGAWKLTSTKNNTWQSKVYLCQYITEKVLGITNSYVNGDVDQIHATFQVTEAPYQGFSDQMESSGIGGVLGSLHYPRGVTSALWWLNATNNPPYPAPTSAPDAPSQLSALPGNHQVLLSWNGSAMADGYILRRSANSGGPYQPIMNSIPGASFTDNGLANGSTYYYVVTATNQMGESLPSSEVSATPMPLLTGPNVGALVNGSALTIWWPPCYDGWVLQTNVVDVRNLTVWGDVPGSGTNGSMSVPLNNPKISAEFFRLRHP